MPEGWSETPSFSAVRNLSPLFPPDIPLLCLQGAALVGLLAAALLLCRRHGWHILQHSSWLGLLIGMTGYLIGALVSSYGEQELRPVLVVDFLYLGAYLGGVRGGLISCVLVEAGRWQFGGYLHPAPAFADGAIHLMSGWALRALIPPLRLERLSFGVVLLVWGGRAMSTLLATLMGAWTSIWVGTPLIDLDLVLRLVQSRVMVLPLSWLIIHAVLLLLANDAQIDAQQAREHQLQRHDQITGLPNRLALTEAVQAAWQRAAGPPLCLAVLELGNMREFLLRHGPEAASQLWQPRQDDQGGALPREALAGLWKLHPRPFQYGDLALALLLEGLELQALERSRQMEAMLQRCQSSLARSWPDFQFEIRCAVVDLAQVARDVPDPPQLPGHLPYGAITMALNSVSRGVAYFNDLMQRDQRLDAYIESQMHGWSQEPNVPLWLQPKVHLSSGRVLGAEALLRLPDHEGRAVSPMRVIATLRRIGRLADFEWATVEAVVQLLQRQAPHLPGVSMAVNLSAESLRRTGFANRVRALLARCQVPPALLRLELVEWSELVNDPKVCGNLVQLSRDGVPLSIDDFGTGYSNLFLLTRYAFSEVKIDRCLVSSMADPKSRAVVEHIVELSHRCEAVVVAEGLETPDQAREVQALGVDVGQGYLFSRALPPDDFVAYCLRPRLVLPV